jgi:hypothetical protein
MAIFRTGNDYPQAIFSGYRQWHIILALPRSFSRDDDVNTEIETSSMDDGDVLFEVRAVKINSCLCGLFATAGHVGQTAG